VRATLFGRGGTPWRGGNPGELRAVFGLTRRRRWRTPVRSKALKAGRPLWFLYFAATRVGASVSVLAV
jgi:hypothetical protein